jgi:lysyl-tRNA synthetase class 2
MPDIKLQFDGKEFVLGDGITTIGRTTDNAVSFPGDSNVSRYHAEIELRGAEYCLIDLNSSNGTSVNGQKVTGVDRLVMLLTDSPSIRDVLLFPQLRNED